MEITVETIKLLESNEGIEAGRQRQAENSTPLGKLPEDGSYSAFESEDESIPVDPNELSFWYNMNTNVFTHNCVHVIIESEIQEEVEYGNYNCTCFR